MKKFLLFCALINSVFVFGMDRSDSLNDLTLSPNAPKPISRVNACFTLPIFGNELSPGSELANLTQGLDLNIGLNLEDEFSQSDRNNSNVAKTLEVVDQRRKVVAQRKLDGLSLAVPVTLSVSSKLTPSSTAIVFSPLDDDTKEYKRKAIDVLVSSVESDVVSTNKKINYAHVNRSIFDGSVAVESSSNK